MDNRESYCTFIAGPVNVYGYRFKYDANKNLVLNYGVNSELDLFINEDNQGELRLLDKSISTIGFEIINRFSLRYDGDLIFSRLPQRDVEDVPRLILERVLLTCPNLDHFEVKEDMQGYKIDIGPRRGVKVSYSNTNGQSHLKVVRLQNIYEHSGVFKSLNYLPNIEVLSCHRSFPDGFDIYNRFKNYNIDLTGFKSLEYFYFDSLARSHHNTSCVIFCFKYTDGDEKNIVTILEKRELNLLKAFA